MARFDQFTEAEQMLISEALNALLPIKVDALATVNAHLERVNGMHVYDAAKLFDGRDFSIPQIRALLTEMNGPTDEEIAAHEESEANRCC